MTRTIAPLALSLCLVACVPVQTRQAAALMESTIVPSSDAIFNAVIYTNGQLVASPQVDADWARLNDHAQNLRAAGTTLKALAPTDAPADWLHQSDAMRDAATAAMAAIEDRNLDGVLDAGSRLYDTCTACHQRYVPEN
ncbi:MAG: hypothetical protein ABL986_19355 [Vicinamibacterales bacterium]